MKTRIRNLGRYKYDIFIDGQLAVDPILEIDGGN